MYRNRKGKKWTIFSPLVWIFEKENGKKLINCTENTFVLIKKT